MKRLRTTPGVTDGYRLTYWAAWLLLENRGVVVSKGVFSAATLDSASMSVLPYAAIYSEACLIVKR
jgi:hypothetical protein